MATLLRRTSSPASGTPWPAAPRALPSDVTEVIARDDRGPVTSRARLSLWSVDVLRSGHGHPDPHPVQTTGQKR